MSQHRSSSTSPIVLDQPSVLSVLFHPHGEAHDFRPRGSATSTEVADGDVVGGYLHLHDDSDVLLLFFHGNGETASDYDGLAPYFNACGVSLWVVDFRGYGRSTGEPTYTRMLQDAETLLDEVRQLEVQAGRTFGRVFVMGRSLGSAAAIHLAEKRSDVISGLVLDSAFANGQELVLRLGGPDLTATELPRFYDSADKMRRCGVPTLLIHGKDDSVIPAADSEALYHACPADQKDLVVIPNAGHNNLVLVGYRSYFARIRSFLADAPVLSRRPG